MSNDISFTLPNLVLLQDCSGDYSVFFQRVYSCFVQDFVASKPVFQGIRLGLKKHPLIDGKEYTFWHLISEGKDEQNRLPVIERMERIRWPRPLIENSFCVNLKVWKNQRGKDTRILIWYETEEYLIVLNERKGFILPWTAYLVKENHSKRKLMKEYEAYIKAKTA